MKFVIEPRVLLDDYVRERASAEIAGPLRRSWFGASMEGNYVDAWRLGYQRIGFFAGSYMMNDSGPDSCVVIEVPATETGIAPSNDGPFGWTGQINGHLADSAVWWAFDLVSEGEARQFLHEQRPSVMFRYFDDGIWCELGVTFDGGEWIVTRTS